MKEIIMTFEKFLGKEKDDLTEGNQQNLLISVALLKKAKKMDEMTDKERATLAKEIKRFLQNNNL